MGFNIGEQVQEVYTVPVRLGCFDSVARSSFQAAALAGGGIDADAGYVGGGGDIFLFRL